MASPHKAQSAHDMDAKDRISTPDHKYLDWEITHMFYAILHLVDDYCIRNGLERAASHAQRNHMMKKHLPQIYHKYRKLLNLSKKARYDEGRNMPREDLDQAARLHKELEGFLSRN